MLSRIPIYWQTFFVESFINPHKNYCSSFYKCWININVKGFESIKEDKKDPLDNLVQKWQIKFTIKGFKRC